MRFVALATCTLLALSSVANASLGSFSGSNGTDSVTVTFPSTGVLDQTPSFFQPSPPSANFGFYWTQTSGNGSAIPGFGVNATTSAGSVDFNRITFNYLPNLNRLEIIDGTLDRRIKVDNVSGPSASATMTLGEVMLTNTSVATIFHAGSQIGGAVPVAVPEPSSFLLGGLVLGAVGTGRVVRKRFAKKAE